MRKLVLTVLWMCVSVFTAQAQDITPTTEPGVLSIASPTDGQQLFGLVEIVGTATHPSLFDGYILEWSNIQNPEVWLPIQQRVNQQVNNGVLGQWDTVSAGVPDGIYQIRLRLFLTDETTQDFQVNNLVLINSAPTQVPTPLPAVPTATIQALPLSGPTPTSVVQQPPTVTPRPTFENPVDLNQENSSGDEENSIFNFSAVQSAFCLGAYFSMAFFALVITYLVFRKQISPFTRRLWWQIRSEFDNDQDY